jgi:hypothetical protein
MIGDALLVGLLARHVLLWFSARCARLRGFKNSGCWTASSTD